MSRKRVCTEETATLLDVVIARSVEAQARFDAASAQVPLRQDTSYLKVFYGTRREKLGYQK